MQVKSSCFQLKGVSRLMLNTELPYLQVGEKTVTRSGIQDTFFGELQVNRLEDAIPPNNVWCVRSRAVRTLHIWRSFAHLEVLCHLANATLVQYLNSGCGDAPTTSFFSFQLL